ncbi:MAG: multidrug ABC transporter [Ruminococcus sp.]|nr:multidrug ABC transporter [Ruminococcus sp.]
MTGEVFVYSLIVLFGVFISAVSQVILKKRASVKADSFIKEYLNAPVIIAYGIFFAATILTIIGYRVVPLSLGGVLDSTSYLFITAAGIIFFKEKLTARRCVALALIITGIIVFSV